MKIIDHITMVKEMPPLTEKDREALNKAVSQMNELAKKFDIKTGCGYLMTSSEDMKKMNVKLAKKYYDEISYDLCELSKIVFGDDGLRSEAAILRKARFYIEENA